MRTHRFVRFLGDRVAEASRDIADTVAATRQPAERITSEDGDPHERVRRALPRTIDAHVDGTEKGSTRFRSMVVTSDPSPTKPGSTKPDLGVVIHVTVPDFEMVSAMVAKTVDAPALDDPEYSLAEQIESSSLGRLLDITPDAFVFVVDERGVHVVPVQAVTGVTDPHRRRTPHRDLYSRHLGRTFEEFAEGFIGDTTVAPALERADSRPDTERRLRSWAESNDLRRVLEIQVSATANETEATLQEYVD